MKLLTISFALLATVLIGAPAASAAESTPALEILSFEARGSGGWVLAVSATPPQGKSLPATISLQTRGPHHQSVEYLGLKARVGTDGAIEAKLPGRGHIAVHFDQTSEEAFPVDGRKGCTVKGRAALLKGVFRGTIEFRGERGYTTVSRTSTRGEILLAPGETCPRRKHHSKPLPPPSHAPGVQYFLAGRDLAGGSLEFSAFRLDRGFFGSPPETEFTARFVRERHGILTIARTEVSDQAKPDFALTSSRGRPNGALATPPAPFSGSGTFTLESPRKASWTGDLSVEVPTLGPVELTGPEFWSGACADKCTKTFPAGIKIGFLTASGRP